jgi:hypothetical protein
VQADVESRGVDAPQRLRAGGQALRRTMQLVAEMFPRSARSKTAALMPGLRPKSSAQMQR